MAQQATSAKLGHWFGAVAAIRPYLFQKCFTLMLAFDLLVLMVERGARYGTDTIPFNVPHFRWIDAVHRVVLPNGVPSDTYYVGCLCLTSFLAFCLFFGGHRKWLMAIVCGMYTYGWSMSRLDSYLHHYMLSLIMLCMVFFPRVNGCDLREWLLSTEDDKPSIPPAASEKSLARMSVSLLGLALAYRVTLGALGLNEGQRWLAMFTFFIAVCALIVRWNKHVRVGNGPSVTAWSYRLLVTTVGVIYIFAAVAKMDAEWCGGHTLRAVGTTEQVLHPVAELAMRLGLAEDTFWSVLATSVIPLELLLAGLYIVSVWQDEPDRGRLSWLCFFGWLLAVGLHLNNEMMNLIIQWFGYYMLLLATVLLLPARILLIAGQVFVWPEYWIQQRPYRLREASSLERTVLTSLAAALTLITMIGFAGLTMIPGAVVAGFLLSAGFILALLLSLAIGKRWRLSLVLVSLVASLSMTIAVLQCSMRFDYFDLRGKSLQQVGRHGEAAEAMQQAMSFPPPSAAAAAELLTNLGISHSRLATSFETESIEAKEHRKRAETAYREAADRNSQQFLAHYSLANLLVDEHRLNEAERHYRQAITINPDISDAMLNLGNLLEFQGRVEEAIKLYEQALSIEPNAKDIQHYLEQAKEKLP